MISYIQGKITEKYENSITLECCGIGYEIFVSTNTLNALSFEDENTKILTYLQVREDGVSLFGFSNIKEKDLFLKLISISGIGPKNAIAILSGFSLPELLTAIATGDKKLLCGIKGLGAKTAERIILELKDKIDLSDCEVDNFENLKQNVIDDATDALISLGVNKLDAYRWAKSVATPESTVEEIITKVLKGMGR